MSAIEQLNFPSMPTALTQLMPSVSAAYAVRKVNGYLGKYVGMFFGGVDADFVATEPPVWQVKITFQLYDIGPFTLGTIDVNALTGVVVPLSVQTITDLQSRANVLAQRSPSSATTAG